MSLAHNPRIVTDGLVLALDAANPKSYPGSGTSWFDLTNTASPGILRTTINHTAGAFNFDGTNDYIDIYPTLSTPNNLTVTGWINPNNQFSRFITPQTNGIDNFIQYNTDQRISVTYCESADTNGRSISASPGTSPINQWSHFAVIISGSTASLYINGVLEATSTESFTIASWNGRWEVGQRGNGTGFYSGLLSSVNVYDKVLTASEVAQNFNALKGRYGL